MKMIKTHVLCCLTVGLEGFSLLLADLHLHLTWPSSTVNLPHLPDNFIALQLRSLFQLFWLKLLEFFVRLAVLNRFFSYLSKGTNTWTSAFSFCELSVIF